MTSSVTKWLSNLSNRQSDSKGGAAGRSSLASLKRGLSSGLSEVKLGLCTEASPSATTVFPSSDGDCFDGKELGSSGAGNCSSSNASSGSLSALFTAVSPYVCAADIRCAPGFRRLYDSRGPVVFSSPPLAGAKVGRGELKLWEVENERIISQNSSNRRVHRVTWTSNSEPYCPRPAALKFVEDGNSRDGRSLKREIECHIYTYQKLATLYQAERDLQHSHYTQYSYTRMPEWSVVEKLEDAWPSAELFGYHLDRRNPGRSVLLTRKLSGPDLFDVIRAEHNHNWHFHHSNDSRCRTVYNHRASVRRGGECVYYPANYEFHKLRWCALALRRLGQYAQLSIRHNDVKPDNIVLDFHYSRLGHKTLDVKLIDLGTASMQDAKDFTGGTSWYESPEQKLLEYFMKKKKNPEAARRVDISLTSDIWGAGISLTEVLVGRRVVDSLKCPSGPGSLDYLGYEASTSRAPGRYSSTSPDLDFLDCGGDLSNYPYWAMDPSEWLLYARRALTLDKDSNQSLSREAAKWLFEHLVRPDAHTRVRLSTAMDKMERFADEAYHRWKHQSNSFDSSAKIAPSN